MSLPAAGLRVGAPTGVDVELALAGPGARAFAFLVDWHIRALLAAAWYIAGALLHNGRLSLLAPLDPQAPWFLLVLAPAAGLYLLYHPVLEIGTRGHTPGKRLAAVRILSRSGGPPTVGALLVRNVFRLIDSLPLLYGVGLSVTLLTREHLRVGDLAAGTVLAYEPRAALADERAGGALAIPVPTPRTQPAVDPQLAELAAELLARWQDLEPAARARLGSDLLRRAGRSAPAAEAQLQEQLAAMLRGSAGTRRTGAAS